MNETPLRLTFEKGDSSAFNAIEAANPAQQFAVVKNSHVFKDTFLGRFLQRASDVWANGTPRCLAARYDTRERAGQLYWFFISGYIPSGQQFGENLMWELHHRANLYNISGLGVAPLALTSRASTDLCWRVAAGRGTTGVGYAVWEINKRIGPLVYDRRIDVVAKVYLSEGADGSVDVWCNTSGTPDPAMMSKPAAYKWRGPTLPYSDSGQHVGDEGLYTELGIYAGGTSVPQSGQSWETFGSVRCTSEAQVVAEISRASTPPPPPPPPAAPKVTSAVSSFQQGAKLLQGTVPWGVETDVPAKQVEWFVAGKSVAIDTTGDQVGGKIVYGFQWDTSKLPVGIVNVGFTVTNADGSKGLSWPSWPVEIVAPTKPPDPVPPPVPPFEPNVTEAKKQARLALDELQLSSGYKTAKRDNPNPASWAKTHIGKCEAAIKAAISALTGTS